MTPDLTYRSLVLTLVAVVVLFALFIGCLWNAGFFKFTGTDPSSKVVTASLTVVGAFVTALLALLGAILKVSADRQVEMRLANESARNAALAAEAADRLQLEAAVKAVQLLATTSGQLTPSIQRAGALFALATLKQYDLTLALTSELLARNELEAGAVARLLNLAMLSESDSAQRQAADLLAARPAAFLVADDWELPQCLTDWNHRLGSHAREWSAIGLARVVIGREINDWKISKLAPLIAALTLAYQTESDERLKNDIGAVVSAILDGFPEIDSIMHPRRELVMDEVRSSTQSLQPVSASVESLVHQIREWRRARR